MAALREPQEPQAEAPARAPAQPAPGLSAQATQAAQTIGRGGNQAMALSLDAKRAADLIIDRLRGYVSEADSHAILEQFEGRGPAAVRAIMAELRTRAAGRGETPAQLAEWLCGDMTAADRQKLRGLLADAERGGGASPDGRTGADAILADLEGVTTAAASHRVLAAFTDQSPATVAAIVDELGARGTSTERLLAKLTAEDRRDLRNLLVRVGPPAEMVRIAAGEVKDRLEGYTSESDSREILAIVSEFADSGRLDLLLTELEKETHRGEDALVEWLFGDMDRTAGEDLRNVMFESGGLKGTRYATLATAAAIVDLLSGFTSHADERSIVRRLGLTPPEYQALVLAELDKATRAKWSKPAEQMLQENLSRGSYEEIREPLGLAAYPGDKRSLGRKAGEWLLEGAGDVVEVAVGAVTGVITGFASLLLGMAGVIIDIPKAAYHLVMSAVHLLSLGALGSEEWLATKEFFAGIGRLVSHPIDTLGTVWQSTAHESATIEGPFEYGRRTEFWVRRVVEFVGNLVLVVEGGLKLGAKGLEMAAEARKIGWPATFARTADRAVVAGRKLVTQLGRRSAKLLAAVRRPITTLSAIRRRLTVILMAADREQVYEFLRRARAGVIEDRVRPWKELRSRWRDLATASDVDAAALGTRASALESEVGAGRAGEAAERQVAELDGQTQALEQNVAAQEKDVFGSGEPGSGRQPAAPEGPRVVERPAGPPHPPRRPGSPSRFTSEEIADDFAEAQQKGARGLPEGTQEPTTTLKRRLAERTDAEMLADNLTREVGSRPPGHSAHHLVPKGMEDAEEAREILREARIGINDAENGAWLAEDETIVNESTGEIHSRLHTRKYVRWLTDLLREGAKDGPDGVHRALADIRKAVMNSRAVR